MQKITPFLWFNDNAEEAMKLYVSLFKDSKILNVTRYGDAGPGPKGTVMVGTFQLLGQTFNALNGGPLFTFTPAISFFAYCTTAADVDALYKTLSKGGEVMMPLDKYPFSERYAFIKDKFGVSWQLMLSAAPPHISPSLLFVGKDMGNAEAAVKLYTTTFKHASVDHIMKYGKGEPGKEGTVKHALFQLEGQEFVAMDGAGPHKFTFNESISFVIDCATQQEVDYFWKALSAGGSTSQCGWLKDKFGVSWQVVPSVLSKLLADKDPKKSARVMKAMLQMTKLDIQTLEAA